MSITHSSVRSLRIRVQVIEYCDRTTDCVVSRRNDDVTIWNNFRITGHSWWESTGDRRCPLIKFLAWTNSWTNRIAGDIRRYDIHMTSRITCVQPYMSGLIPVLRPANERRRYKVTPPLYHWLGANLESALHVVVKNTLCIKPKKSRLVFLLSLWHSLLEGAIG